MSAASSSPSQRAVDDRAKPTSRRWADAALILSVTLAGFGEWLLTARPGWPQLFAPSFVDQISPIWDNADEALAAIGLFLVAIALFAVALDRLRPWRDARALEIAPVSARRPDVIALGLGAAGIAVLGWTLYLLAATDYEPSYPRWYCLSLAFLLAALVWN